MKLRYNFWQNLVKMFSYIHGVSLEDISLEYKDKKMFLLKFDIIDFGPSFFRDFSCLGCGKCCIVGFPITLTESDYKILGFSPTDTIMVNDISISMFAKPYERDTNCPFLDNNLCTIHGHHPITCHAPHRAVKIFDGKALWIKKQYGRNWAWKDKSRACPGVPSNNYSEKEITSDIIFFHHLERVCDDLNLKNYCGKLIAKLHNYSYTGLGDW